MAKYRQVHLTFWQDPFIEELEPLEKYFYLYLMTNSKTTQCGCYEISMKLIKYETGLKQSQIDTFIKLLEDCNKIGYNKDNSEFLIVNWLKHNSFKSPKVKACIEKELSSIKTVFYKEYINTILNGIYPIDSLSKQVHTPIDTQSQQEQEQEQEQTIDNELPTECFTLSDMLIQFVKSKHELKIDGKKRNSWACHFDKLHRLDGVDFKKQINAMAWMIENKDYEYMPIIESGKSFREKWTKLCNAKTSFDKPQKMQGSLIPDVDPNDPSLHF